MTESHDRRTVVSMAVVGQALAVLLHEGVGHGVTAWLRGAGPVALTSNHLSSLREDRWVDAGGTLVNLAVGVLALLLANACGRRANARYALWLFAALNLFPAAGYFLFSGVFGFGDWYAIIKGMPHEGLGRVGMAVFGASFSVLVAWRLALSLRPFFPEASQYNAVARIPYLAACVFNCIAGSLDPLGLRLWLTSTVPAAFGGLSGFLWADSLVTGPSPEAPLVVRRAPVWWVAAVVLGLLYIVVIGRGVHTRGWTPDVS